MIKTFNFKKTVIFLLIISSALTYGKEWVKNGDFEDGKTDPWRLIKPNQNVSLSIVTDSASPCGGSGAFGITMSKEKRIDIIQYVKIGPGKYKLTAYMDTTRCTRPGGYIMLYLSGSVKGKWHNFGAVFTGGSPKKRGVGWQKTVWQKHEKIITVPEGGVIKGINISLFSLTGTVMLDGISLRDYNDEDARIEQEQKQKAAEQAANSKAEQASAPQVMFQSRKRRNLFRQEETPEFGFELKNPSDREVSLKARFTTTDYFGRTVLKSEKEFKIPAKGKISEVLRYPECTLPGFYCTNAEWECGKITKRVQASFVKVGPVPEKKDPLFGISCFAPADAVRYELLGVGSKFVKFWWVNSTNKKAVEKNLNEIKELKRRGIDPIGGFSMSCAASGWNGWQRWLPKDKVRKGQSPSIQDIEKTLVPFIEETVRSCRPYVRHWYLSGEINLVSQQDPKALERYLAMTKFSSKAIKKANPEAVVASLCVTADNANQPFPFISKYLPELKDYLDGIAPDAYSQGQRYGNGYQPLNSEEGKIRFLMQTAVKMAKDAGKKHVAIAERGPSITRSEPLDSPYGKELANTVARDYIILKTVPEVHTCLYFRPDNWDSKSIIDWGMWEKEDPRQVVSAYAATARIMAFAEFVKELPLHQDIPCWIFRKDGKYYASVWYNGKEKLKVVLPADIQTEIRDVQGNPVVPQDHIIYLDSAPVYLYAKSIAELKKMLKNAANNVSELSFLIDRQKAGRIILMIQNRTGHEMKLKLQSAEVGGPGNGKKKFIPYQDEMTLASGEIKTLEKPISGDEISFHFVTGNGRKYTASAKLKPVLVPRVGGFTELKGKAVPLLLNNPMRQIPGYDDLKVHGVYTGENDLSGSFRLGYDDQYLYLEVQVKDDIHLNENHPSRIFTGDCIQFAVDANRDAKMKKLRGITGYSNDDFNFISALAKGKPITRCFVAPSGLRGKLLGKNYSITPEITRDEKAKTTLYRVKIAFADLAPLKPEKGRNFGFSLIIFDKDTPTSFYHMDYSAGVCHPFEPAKYPAFQFE